MGISRATAEMLLEEARRRPFAGTVATLGRQHIYFTWEDFSRLAKSVGVPVPSNIIPKLHREPMLAENNYVSDNTIFAGLGFSESVRIDYSDFEESEELFDLNLPQPPAHLLGCFDVIFNIGTLEHVFHVPNLLRNLHLMLKPGGRIIHLSPSANYMDHGFYSISPTFFADYYRVNQYRIHELLVCRLLSKTNSNSPVETYDYLSESRSAFEVGSLDDRIYNIWAVVEKTADSTSDVIPQQGHYNTEWAKSATTISSEQANEGREPVGTKADRILRMTANCGIAHRAAKALIREWRKLVNQYRRARTFPLPRSRIYRG